MRKYTVNDTRTTATFIGNIDEMNGIIARHAKPGSFIQPQFATYNNATATLIILGVSFVLDDEDALADARDQLMRFADRIESVLGIMDISHSRGLKFLRAGDIEQFGAKIFNRLREKGYADAPIVVYRIKRSPSPRRRRAILSNGDDGLL